MITPATARRATPAPIAKKAKEGGKKDTQPDAIGVSKKAGIEMHTSATSGSSESSEWDDSMGLCHTWRRSANRGGYSTSSHRVTY